MLVELANELREFLDPLEVFDPMDERPLTTPGPPKVIALSALPLRDPKAPIPARLGTLLVPEELADDELLAEPDAGLIVESSVNLFLMLSAMLIVLMPLRTEDVGLRGGLAYNCPLEGTPEILCCCEDDETLETR